MYFINTKMEKQENGVVDNSVELIAEVGKRILTASEFQFLADVPAELEWFANIQNANTRRAYKNDVHDFMEFAGKRGVKHRVNDVARQSRGLPSGRLLLMRPVARQLAAT